HPSLPVRTNLAGETPLNGAWVRSTSKDHSTGVVEEVVTSTSKHACTGLFVTSVQVRDAMNVPGVVGVSGLVGYTGPDGAVRHAEVIVHPSTCTWTTRAPEVANSVTGTVLVGPVSTADPVA